MSNESVEISTNAVEVCVDDSNAPQPDASMETENSASGHQNNEDVDKDTVSQIKTNYKSMTDDQQSTVQDNILVEDSLDPGSDLLKAANMLNNLISPNPLLQALTDYLVDEGSAEEELLISGGMQSMTFINRMQSTNDNYMNNDINNNNNVLSADESLLLNANHDRELLRVLDQLLFYLRIVHSVDFYAPSLYRNEYLMPHPCRIIHVRPGVEQVRLALFNKKPSALTNGPSLESINKVFTSQLKRLIKLVRPLNPQNCQSLGLRDPEQVVDAFIKANTRRKKRKTDVIWVCPLSNKKFRDPIFVKKHILNKYLDKVEDAKKDNAFFFNNYLLDPARPQYPIEPRLPKRRSDRSMSPATIALTTAMDQRNKKQLSRFSKREHTEQSRSRQPSQGGQKWNLNIPNAGNRTNNNYNNNNNNNNNRRFNYNGRGSYSQPRAYYGNQRSLYNNNNAMRSFGGGNFSNTNFNNAGFRRNRPSYIDLDAV